MEQPATFPDWPAKRAELRRRLATRRPKLDHRRPLPLSIGAVVAPHALTPPLSARRAFLWVASETTTALLIDLADAPLDEFATFWEANGGPEAATSHENISVV